MDVVSVIGQVYLNGEWCAPDEAKISAFDRGFFFADGVYEVIPISEGEPFGLEPHLDRLFYSLKEIRLPINDSRAQLRALIIKLRDTLLEHGHQNGAVYLQITRGAAKGRDHAFPTPSIMPTQLAYAFAIT
ncbi:MAG TPA: aminotransferase IV, partial [Halothiobacillaceae bacterium]|nr:aminotransferase IV [Halothiobacillaceae bacterium]